MTTYEEEFDLNTVLAMTGTYLSENHLWDIPVSYSNLSYSVSLNGGVVEIYFETSDDNFNTILNTQTVQLEDGISNISLKELGSSDYIRFTINIRTTENITPRIHKLDINGSGQWQVIETDMKLNLISIRRDIFIQNLVDFLTLKKYIPTKYIYELLTLKLNESISSLIDTFLRLTVEDSNILTSTLKILGRYTSEHYSWGQLVNYANIEVSSTLYGCDVKLIVETSNDNFSNILDSKTITLTGGLETISINDLDNSIYVRYRVILSSIYAGITPRIHRLTMNVEGVGTLGYPSPMSIDMLVLNPNLTSSIILNVILGESIDSYSIPIDIDTLLRITTDLISNINLVTKLVEIKNINLDLYLKSKIENKEVIDIILSKSSKQSYSTDTVLQGFESINTYKDVLVQFINNPTTYLFNTELLLDDMDIQTLIDVIITLSNESSFDFDTLLKLTTDTSLSFNTRLYQHGIEYLFSNLDSICRKNNITLSELFDVLTLIRQSTSFDLDTYIKLTNREKQIIDTHLQYNNITSLMNIIDTITESRNITKSILFDIITKIINDKSIVMDVFLKVIQENSLNIDAYISSPKGIQVLYDLDLILRKYNLSTQNLINIITIITMKSSFNIDSLILLKNKTTNTSYDTFTIKGDIISNYIIDLYISLQQQTNYIIDSLIRGESSNKYTYNLGILKQDLESNFNLTTRLWLYTLFIDYAKQIPSNLYNIINVISSANTLTNTISEFISKATTTDVHKYLTMSNSSRGSYNTETLMSLTGTPTTTNMFSITITQECVDDELE